MSAEKEILLIGSSFKSTSIDVRERITPSADVHEDFLQKLHGLPSVSEAVVIATCNRIEYYSVTGDARRAYDEITDLLQKTWNVTLDDLQKACYTRFNKEAIRHLLRVSASLDSLVIGENQILGQLKRNYELAMGLKTTSSVFNKLFQHAIQTGKMIRSKTMIGSGAVSIGSATIELIKEIFAVEKSNYNVLLLGAGEIAEVMSEQLLRTGNPTLTIANRSRHRAEELAARFEARVIDFEDRYAALSENDIIIVSTGSPDFILEKKKVEQQLFTKRKGIHFFIDLSVPRNIDPTVNQIDDLLLYCIDDLKSIIENNRERRQAEIDQAEQLINSEVDEFASWQKRQLLFSTLAEIKQTYRQKADESLRLHGIMNGDDQAQKLLYGFIDSILNVKTESDTLSKLASLAAALQEKEHE